MKRTILPLSLAALLTACGGTRRTSTVQTQTRATHRAACHTDSTGLRQMAVGLERLADVDADIRTDIIVFDTGAAPTESTGLPPVKAIVHRRHKQTKRSREAATCLAEHTVQTHTEATTADHEQTATTDSRERKSRPGLWLWLAIAAAIVAAYASWIIYHQPSKTASE